MIQERFRPQGFGGGGRFGSGMGGRGFGGREGGGRGFTPEGDGRGFGANDGDGGFSGAEGGPGFDASDGARGFGGPGDGRGFGPGFGGQVGGGHDAFCCSKTTPMLRANTLADQMSSSTTRLQVASRIVVWKQACWMRMCNSSGTQSHSQVAHQNILLISLPMDLC